MDYGISSASDKIVLRITLDAMRAGREDLLGKLRRRPEHELQHIKVEGKTTAKEMLSCDRDAEANCREFLETSAKKEGIEIKVLGEESLWDTSIKLSKRDPYVVLLDMVDGSDLLERDFGNWCSAATIFKPRLGKIIASIVQDYHNNLYVATNKGAFFRAATTSFVEIDDKPVCKITFLSGRIPLAGPRPPFEPLDPKKKDDRYASICFYAQKADHFVGLPKHFVAWLNDFGFAGRLYTLAGNPMMAKLANGERVHVVFEHVGQFAHDAVPGLYIALKAHATVVALDGTGISEGDLANCLYTPSKVRALRYVLACTEQLAQNVARALTGPPRPDPTVNLHTGSSADRVEEELS